MWRYNLSEKGRSWKELPKETTGDRFSSLGVYRDKILGLYDISKRNLSAPEISHETGIEKKAVNNMVRSYARAGFLVRQWSLK